VDADTVGESHLEETKTGESRFSKPILIEWPCGYARFYAVGERFEGFQCPLHGWESGEVELRGELSLLTEKRGE
jgi:hypothetical protein